MPPRRLCCGQQRLLLQTADENMDQNFLLRVIKCSSIDFLKVIVSYHSQGNGSNFPSHCFYFAVASMTFSTSFQSLEEDDSIQHFLWKHFRLDSGSVSQCIKESSLNQWPIFPGEFWEKDTASGWNSLECYFLLEFSPGYRVFSIFPGKSGSWK